MRHLSSLVLVVLLSSLGGAMAEAGTVYDVSGDFGADYSSTTGLAYGSFTGTYQTESFPTTYGTYYVDSFSVSMFNASGTLVDTISSTNDMQGFFAAYSGFPNEFAEFVDPTSHFALILAFAFGFDGTGAVIPTPGGTLQEYTSKFYNGSTVTITSGFSSLAGSVPEPSSLIMAGLGGLMVWGFCSRRRRPDADSQ